MNDHLSKSPNFFVLGGQKCGSTWLADKIGQHPDVYMAKQEIHFFDKGYNYDKGLNWYLSHFEDTDGECCVGEKTPEYLFAGGAAVDDHRSDVHVRLTNHFPDAKFVVTVRNPIDRAVSALLHTVRTRRLPLLKPIDRLFDEDLDDRLSEYAILEKGLYAKQLEHYFAIVPPERFKVVIFEDDLLKHPAQTLKSICIHLDIDPSFEFDRLRQRDNPTPKTYADIAKIHFGRASLQSVYHSLFSRTPIDLSARTRQRLQKFYKEPNQQLRDLINLPLSSWD